MSNVQTRPTVSHAVVTDLSHLFESQASESLGTSGLWTPSYERIETAKGLTFFFDVPGVMKRHLHVTCEEGRLWVWGARGPAGPVHPQTMESNRPLGSFAIDLPLNEKVDASRILHDVKDGVLQVFIPNRRASIKSRHEA